VARTANNEIVAIRSISRTLSRTLPGDAAARQQKEVAALAWSSRRDRRNSIVAFPRLISPPARHGQACTSVEQARDYETGTKIKVNLRGIEELRKYTFDDLLPTSFYSKIKR
jgi:hypothetical protein